MKHADIKFRCGEKLKAVRERRDMTLQDLSAASGLSKGMLSQIENNRVSPSMDSLLNISAILDVDLEYLFRDYRRNKKVHHIKADERDSISRGRVLYEKLTPQSPEKNGIEAYELTIPPGEEKGDAEYGHQGWELGVLIMGQGRLTYGTQTHNLREGDSVSFESDIPHILKNTGENTLKAYWVLTSHRK